MTMSLPRDGGIPMMGSLPMGGFKITGLGAGSAPGDAARIDQVLPFSAYLASVSALALTADQLPYSTGGGAAAAAAFTATGRAIVGAATVAAARTAIGITTADPGLALVNAAVAHDQAAWTAGTATTPSLPTPAQAKIAFSSQDLGVGQTWQNVSGSRTAGTTYQNTTGKPIMISVRLSVGALRDLEISANGTDWVKVATSGAIEAVSVSSIIPAGHYYRVLVSYGSNTWTELR